MHPLNSGHADTDMDGRSAREDGAGSDASDASDASGASVAPSWVQDEMGLPERDFRLKTVYDAVAGGVRVHETRSQNWAGTPARYIDSVLTPEEALYRSIGAPDRYEETDTYFAHEALPAGALPDSDLVKAVHHYASQYYEALALPTQTGKRKRKRKARDAAAENNDTGDGTPADDTRAFAYAKQRLLDERSMDETALLAFGILLEEAGRQALGEHGDLLFTEEAEGQEWEEEEEEEEEDQEDQEDQEELDELEAKTKAKGKAKKRMLDVQSGKVDYENSDE